MKLLNVYLLKPFMKFLQKDPNMFVKIDSFYSKNGEALKDLIEKTYYINSNIQKCDYNGEGLTLELSNKDKRLKKIIKDEIINISSKILKSFEKIDTVILFENEGGKLFNNDPMDQLLSSGQVVETYPGVFALQGGFLNKINELDSFFKNFALKNNAIEQQYQPILATQSLIDNGYLSSFPHHPLFVANIRRDSKSIKKLAENSKNKSIQNKNEWLDNSLDTHSKLLSPTICYHCFEVLKNSSIPEEGKKFTAIGSCHRYESNNIEGLSRLQAFTMREIIFFGTSKFVEENRNEILDHCKSYLIDLNLKFRIVTASDPFFVTGSESKRIFQKALRLKYEIQAYIPHSDTWISIASFNNHQSSLVEKYSIRFDGEEDLYSGCVGYGYERFVYALLSQHGF